MLKKKKAVEEDYDMELELEEEEDEPPKRSRQKKEKKSKPVKEKKQKASGFFGDEAFAPYTGKINSIRYFVISLMSIWCPLFLLFGGSSAKKARNYMTETGDAEGVGFLAAGKAIKSTVLALWLMVLLVVVISLCSAAFVVML